MHASQVVFPQIQFVIFFAVSAVGWTAKQLLFLAFGLKKSLLSNVEFFCPRLISFLIEPSTSASVSSSTSHARYLESKWKSLWITVRMSSGDYEFIFGCLRCTVSCQLATVFVIAHCYRINVLSNNNLTTYSRFSLNNWLQVVSPPGRFATLELASNFIKVPTTTSYLANMVRKSMKISWAIHSCFWRSTLCEQCVHKGEGCYVHQQFHI